MYVVYQFTEYLLVLKSLILGLELTRKWVTALEKREERGEEVAWDIHRDGGVIRESQAVSMYVGRKTLKTWALNPGINFILRIRLFPVWPYKSSWSAFRQFKGEHRRAWLCASVTASCGQASPRQSHREKQRNQTKGLMKTVATDVHACSHFPHLNLPEAKVPLVSNYAGNFPRPHGEWSIIK